MSDPLCALSPSKQNIRLSPLNPEQQKLSHDYHIPESKLLTANNFMTPPRVLIESLDQPRPQSAPIEARKSPSMALTPKGASTGLPKSPRTLKLSPSSPLSDIKTDESAATPPSPSESTLRFNEGLTHALGDVQDQREGQDIGIHQDVGDEGMSTIMHGASQDDKTDGADDDTEITLTIDDTVGDLSTLSAVANADMTQFASIRTASPTRIQETRNWSPQNLQRSSFLGTPGTVKRRLHLGSKQNDGSDEDVDATPRRPYSVDSPTDLLNFTGQSNIFIPPPGSASRMAPRRSMSGRGSFPVRVHPSPSHRSQASIDRERSRGNFSPSRQNYPGPSVPATPAEGRSRICHVGDLLDFDLEPLPTPRSIPTITPRELETLRSEMQSQIAGLSATLSGKEAEVMALKRSITDAEVRVGNTSEELRNERNARDVLEDEKTEWESHRREMENVLREVKQDIMIADRERDKLRKQVEDTEKRAEEQEVRILELEAMLESSRKQNGCSPKKGGDGPATPGTTTDVEAAVKDATERVARELHSLYKSKHETKVAALKNSYQARWEKKVRELESNLQTAKEEVVALRRELGSALDGSMPEREEQRQKEEELAAEMERIKAEKKMLHDRIAGLEEEKKATKDESEILRADLERERIEKGELVAQVDLFLSMDAEMKTTSSASIRTASAVEMKPVATSNNDMLASPSATPTRITTDKFRSSIHGSGGGGRPGLSMLKQPKKSFSGLPGPATGAGGGGESRIGRGAPPTLVGRGIATSVHSRSIGGGGGSIMEGITRMGMGAGGGGAR